MSLSNKKRNDYEEGKSVENNFIGVLESKDFDVIKSTSEQDMTEGWDIYVTTVSNNKEFPNIIGKKIDVKGIKGDDYNWVEFMAKDNVNYKLGWSLRESDVDYIAFKRLKEFGGDFLLVKKSDLKKFIFSKIPLLQKFHNEIKHHQGDNEKYNKMFKLKISSQWGEFNSTDNKEESLYEKVYIRNVKNRFPDMITKIKDSDLSEIATYKIK